ncbi:MAG TPA: transporter substrate-binding domain-containing protein [Clostridia bacterium]|jgi:ABC-type amino acid transport substrate-binding protein|nr:transporter substrate-binding domain-containing protein [Clostridiaceae bacterium]HOA30407.1 transporter substrate-binding domain-containing protein [Clostridia bacterium]HPZ51653.1 transporter substrate-binding domain-containing protein [Clostridia bacterium]
MKKTLLIVTVLIIVLASACTPNIQKNFVVLEDYFAEEEYGIGFRNTDIALGLEVQKHLDEMYEDGTLIEISKKWFGKDTYLKDSDFIEESQAPEGDDSLDKILDKGKLIVGLDDSFPPMGFRDDKNNIVGYDIDLAKEVAKRMDVELVLQPIDWDSKELELQSGKIDCIWNGMTITEERVEAMYFVKPYIANRQIVIVGENSDIKTKADLNGKKIGLQKGSSALNAVKADDVYSKIGEIIEYQNNVDAFNDLKVGRIDALVVDEVAGRYMIEKDKDK